MQYQGSPTLHLPEASPFKMAPQHLELMSLVGGQRCFLGAVVLRFGTHAFSARYSGDQIFRPSTSILYQVVATPDFSLTSSAVAPWSYRVVSRPPQQLRSLLSLVLAGRFLSHVQWRQPKQGRRSARSRPPWRRLPPANSSDFDAEKSAQVLSRLGTDTVRSPGGTRRIMTLWLSLFGLFLAGLVLAGGRGRKQSWLSCLFACTLMGMIANTNRLWRFSRARLADRSTGKSFAVRVQGQSGAAQHIVSLPVIVD